MRGFDTTARVLLRTVSRVVSIGCISLKFQLVTRTVNKLIDYPYFVDYLFLSYHIGQAFFWLFLFSFDGKDKGEMRNVCIPYRYS